MNRIGFTLGIGLAVALMAGADRPSLIATGWDNPTPAQFRDHLAAFGRTPFDGAVIVATRQTADGDTVRSLNAFTAEPWTEGEFAQAIADLKAAKPTRPMRHFLSVYANPGDVGWFDDAAWTQVVEHWRLLARVAHEGGLAGLLFDAEPYTKPFQQFNPSRQKDRSEHSFTEFAAKARERGRAVMNAVATEHPDATILTYRLLCDLLPAASVEGDPAALLETSTYGLMPAFLDGMLDVIPPTITIIEGDENAYRFNADADFDASFVDLRTKAIRLVAPENRATYRAQVLIGHGLYLDAHVNPPTSNWYIDRKGGTSAARLEANTRSALRTAEPGSVVWIYGERGKWWDSGPKDRKPWDEIIPGASIALRRAADPTGVAIIVLDAADASSNRLQDPGFDADGTELPASWWTWKDDGTPGTFARDPDVGASSPGAGRMAGCDAGVIGQTIPVRPGDLYAVSARAKQRGQNSSHVAIRWKDGRERWTAQPRDVLLAVGTPDANGWSRAVGLVRVPEGAERLVLLLAAGGQPGADDAAWFDDAAVVPVPEDGP
jgi:hypothetical protein